MRKWVFNESTIPLPNAKSLHLRMSPEFFPECVYKLHNLPPLIGSSIVTLKLSLLPSPTKRQKEQLKVSLFLNPVC